jgi:hypothetical protein
VTKKFQVHNRTEFSSGFTGAGSAGITMQTGSGTLVSSGASSYVGTTTISAGTFLANNTAGSATGTGAISVGINGTLGGTGRLAPTGVNGISVSGTVAPGASIESLEINLGGTTGTVSMLSGSEFKFELGAAGAAIGTPGTSDLLLFAGTTASDVAFNNNSIDFLGTGSQGWYKLFDTDLGSGTTWNGLTLAGQQIASGLNVTNLGSGLTGTLIVGDGVLGDRDDVYLQVVPEPGTWAILLGGFGMLLGLQRRRHRGSRFA